MIVPKRNKIELLPYKSDNKFEVLGPSLVKIYENLRKIPWFLDWALASFIG